MISLPRVCKSKEHSSVAPFSAIASKLGVCAGCRPRKVRHSMQAANLKRCAEPPCAPSMVLHHTETPPSKRLRCQAPSPTSWQQCAQPMQDAHAHALPMHVRAHALPMVGQRVRTQYGEGMLMNSNSGASQVQLSWGTCYVGPHDPKFGLQSDPANWR